MIELPVKILMIEDNPGDAKLITLMLSEVKWLHHELHWVNNLTAGIDYLRTMPVDVVLLDLELPESRGLETLRRMQVLLEAMPTVVVLSGFDDEDCAVEAVHVGAQDYLFKGKTDAPLLARSVRYAIERSKAKKALQESLESLRETQAQLVEAEKLAALGKLVGGVAHEMNTPAGNIIMASSTMQDILDKLAEAEQAGSLTRAAIRHAINECKAGNDIIARNAQRVGRLVAQFKQVSSDQLCDQRQRFLVGEHLRQVIELLECPHKQSNITLDVQLDTNIEMDSYPAVLAQVVTNLIENAQEHAFAAASAGRVKVRLLALPDHQIEIVVADNGCGISHDALRHVLEPFYTTHRATGHVGLGLPIVYNAVTSILRGKIKIDSVLDRGTTVYLTLPTSVGHESVRSL